MTRKASHVVWKFHMVHTALCLSGDFYSTMLQYWHEHVQPPHGYMPLSHGHVLPHVFFCRFATIHYYSNSSTIHKPSKKHKPQWRVTLKNVTWPHTWACEYRWASHLPKKGSHNHSPTKTLQNSQNYTTTHTHTQNRKQLQPKVLNITLMIAFVLSVYGRYLSDPRLDVCLSMHMSWCYLCVWYALYILELSWISH